MARGKKKGGKRRGDDSDDEDDDDDAPQQQQAPPQQGGGKKGAAPAEEEKKLSRKEKRMQKQNKKNANGNDDDGDDGDGDDDGHDAHMNGDIAALMSGKIKNTYGDDSEDSDDEPPLVKAKPAGKKKKGRAAVVALAALESSSEEEQEEENIEDDADLDNDDDDNDEEVEQVAFTLVDDDWGASKKKKKRDKKEKKHKKEKKKKKEDDDGGSDNEDMASKKKHKKHSKKQQLGDDDDDHSDDSSGNADVDKITQAVSDIKVDEPKQKSKFELQMEAALKKKEADKKPAPETAPPAKKEKAKRKGLEPELEPKPEPAVAANEEEEEDDDIMYGHKGDVAWTDKSHAIREAETATSDDDHDLHFGPDGKKLSNKERKKVAKARAAAEREAEYEATAAKASKEGAQFACSQTAVNEKDPQWQNSMDINIPNFSISAAGKILFKDAALTIGHGRRYGLVGANGRGKSTLLKMIASRDLKLPPRVDFLYVEQEVEADDTPAVEAVLRADKVRWDLMEEEKELMKAVDAGDESEVKIDRLQQVVDELTNMGADSAEAKARRILYGLGFTMEMQTKPTKMFSGGWRMRISLARALFVEPTLLMLDEPTNHLDLNAVIWLDEYLQKWKKTLFVVSHDQDFLNSVCQEVLHIEDLKLASYKGNYDSFKKAEKVKFQQHVKSWEKQEKRIKELKRQGQSRAKATETVKKSSKREAGARSQKKKNDAVAAGTEAAEAAQLIIRPKEYHVKLEFAEVAELSRPVMEVNNVHFRYSPKHPVIFDKVDFGIDMDSRICIVGPNGAGKSTLLKLLTGEEDPTEGDVRRNGRLRMGIYNQHFVDRLPMTKTPVEHLRDRFEDETYQSVRNRLGKYGLEGHAHEVTMRDLSGGQKARVVFVELSLQQPHILLLDEPTNNLDIETIDALCDAINEFNGGIVVVTHDQRLIEECDLNLWVVEKQGVTEWVEGFDDYKENILKELEAEVEREAAVRKEKLEVAAVTRAEKIARLASKVKAGKKK